MPNAGPIVAVTEKHLGDAEGRRLWERVGEESKISPNEPILIDLTGVRHLDTRGGAWLRRLKREAADRGGAVEFQGAIGHTKDILELLSPTFDKELPKAPRKPGIAEATGGWAYEAMKELKDAWNLLTQIAYYCLIGPFQRGGFRWGTFVEEIHEIGVKSVTLTLLINFLMGLIITVLSAIQAKMFGAELSIAQAMVIGFERELAVVMTGVVVASRVGAFIAAELATMTVQEEIDSLRSMGKNPIKYLVAPKMLAVNVCMPILTLFGLMAGLAGGTAYAITALDIPFEAWYFYTEKSFRTNDIMFGLMKSFVMGSVIVFVGCHNGLRVTGGARGVGIATTRSVVQDVVILVIIDMIFALSSDLTFVPK